jgi:putative thiamine transport system ATP-binding protein
MTNGGLALRSINIAWRDRPLIRSLTLTIAPGEVVTVMGPSGSGKSSLLAYISGTLDRAFSASGHILIDGDDLTGLPPERRRIGILFQDDMLFPHLSAGENLAFALTGRIRDRAARRTRIEAALAEADLAGFSTRDPATLSGGQRARIALLRTLLAEPRALLLDEPFGRLDDGLRSRFRSTVFEHARARGLPTLLVTHDSSDARAAGGRTIRIGYDDDVIDASTIAPDRLARSAKRRTVT